MDPRLSDIENRLRVLEDSKNLGRSIGSLDKKVIEDVFTDSAIDLVWSNYIFFTPFFADQARFTVPAGATGNFGISSTGFSALTGALNGSFDGADLLIEPSVFKLERETRFRVTAKVDSVSNVQADAYTLTQGSNLVGFRFLNGTLYGISQDSGGTTSISLQTYVASTSYELEFQYQRGGIKFFVNGVEKGSTSARLPGATSSSSLISLFGMYVTTTAAAAKLFSISYVDVIQRKK